MAIFSVQIDQNIPMWENQTFYGQILHWKNVKRTQILYKLCTSEIGSRQKHKNAVHSSDILSPSDNNCFTFISVALIYFVKQNGRHVLIFFVFWMPSQ